MPGYSRPLEDLIEKYDLRYDEPFADEGSPEPEEDYIQTVQKIIAGVE